MTELGSISTIAGLVLLCVFASFIFVPARAREWLKVFPRSSAPAYVIAAIDIVWAARALLDAHIEWVDANTGFVLVMTPVVYFVIVLCMKELLAARALGGLLLLAARPMLAAAFPYDSQVRLFVTILAYIMILAGMALVWSPYVFRKTCEWLVKGRRMPAAGLLGMLAGVMFVLLGVFVY